MLTCPSLPLVMPPSPGELTASPDGLVLPGFASSHVTDSGTRDVDTDTQTAVTFVRVSRSPAGVAR